MLEKASTALSHAIYTFIYYMFILIYTKLSELAELCGKF